MTSKTCTVCGVVKPLGDFYRDARRRDGRMSSCKDCHKAAKRASDEAHKAQRDQYHAAYREAHKVDLAQAAARRRAEHPEQERETQAKTRAKRREQIRRRDRERYGRKRAGDDREQSGT